jgi:hypothetical protein
MNAPAATSPGAASATPVAPVAPILPTPPPAWQPPLFAKDAKPVDAFPELARQPNLRAELVSVKQRAAAAAKQPSSTQPLPASALAKVLPARIDTLASVTGPQPSTHAAGGKPMSGTSQSYRDGSREVFIRILDTAQAAFMRDSVLSRLDRQGNPSQGFIHGRMVKGHPAVVQFFAESRSSQISVLVHDRWVVDVRVLGAKSQSDAQAVFESLPLSALGK